MRRNLQKESKLGKRKTADFSNFEHKSYSSTGILLIYHSVLSFNIEVVRFQNTVSYWLVQLFVTRARQLDCESLKTRHLVITTFTHAQTFDCCDQSMWAFFF